MNDTWGQFPEEGQAVYAQVGGPLPEVGTPPFVIDQLSPRARGYGSDSPIRKELDGCIEGFGSRFLSAVEYHCRPLKDQLEKAVR